jgi:hypothetical protein
VVIFYLSEFINFDVKAVQIVAFHVAKETTFLNCIATITPATQNKVTIPTATDVHFCFPFADDSL